MIQAFSDIKKKKVEFARKTKAKLWHYFQQFRG